MATSGLTLNPMCSEPPGAGDRHSVTEEMLQSREEGSLMQEKSAVTSALHMTTQHLWLPCLAALQNPLGASGPQLLGPAQTPALSSEGQGLA